MSIHPSFKSGKSKIQKSVLKRLERILKLQQEDKWDEEEDSVLGLPKVKIMKMKFKKEKKAAEEATAEGETTETKAAEGKEEPAKEGPAEEGGGKPKK